MKRIILTLLLGLLFAVASHAQTHWFKATEFAYKVDGYDWSDWERVSIKIKIDLDDDCIVIYSKETQVYVVTEILDPPYDPDGEQVKFEVVDQDFDTGYLRLRIHDDGYSQLYVDFADISWVYNVKRIR